MVALKQIDAESENVSASLGVLARDGADRAAGHHRHQHVLLPQRHGHALVAPGTELAALAVLLMDDAGDAAQAAAMSVPMIAIGLGVSLGYRALMRGVNRRAQAWLAPAALAGER